MAGRRLTLMNDDSSRYGLRSQTVATSQNEHYTMVINYKKDKKKRMSDHSRRHTKPTSEEVYQDAKRILEEYLKRKLSEHSEHGENNNKKYSRTESYKAASREDVVGDQERDEKIKDYGDEQHGVERSKTMPSSFRMEKSLDHHDHNKEKSKKKKVSKDKYSSPETDAEHSDDEDTQRRKKKSFFKRAKERLIHAFHRDSRSGDEELDIYDEDAKEREKKKKKKLKSKKIQNGVYDSPDMNNRHIKETHAHIDQHLTFGDDHVSKWDSLKVPSGNGSSSLQDSHSSSSRRNSAGKKLLDSIRKSFRKGKKDIKESKSAEPVTLDDRDRSYSRSNSTPDRSGHLGDSSHHENTSLGIQSRGGSETPERRLKDRTKNDDSSSRRSSKSKADIVVSQSRDHSAKRTIQAHGVHGDGNIFPGAAHSPYVPPHFQGSIDSSVDIERTELTCADDGLWERSVTTHSRERTKYMPQRSLEIDGKSGDKSCEDEIDSPIDSLPDREETIDKIVKKLIEIGDNLSSESEALHSQESEGAVGGASRGGDALDALQKELIECLRQGGDRASHNIDDQANDFINGAVRETVYEKFSTTLRQSIGDEVNWNQMALVFHTTKSALKVAGAGTKMASQIKDLTLTYLTEKYASWIVDQGGWESIVSDTDSDHPELD